MYSHLSEYEDGQNETILSYIDGCLKAPPYQPETPSVCLQVASSDDLEALIFFVRDALGNVRSDFISAVKNAQSSTAKDLAYSFKHLLKINADLSLIAKERHPDWAKAIGID